MGLVRSTNWSEAANDMLVRFQCRVGGHPESHLQKSQG